MAETDGDKTQDATPHRRQQAREEGQVAKSQDLASAALLLVGLAALLWLGGPVVEMLGRYATEQLGGDAWLTADPQFFVAHEQHVAYALAGCLLPIFGLLMFTGIAANFFQVGFLFLPEKLAPDLTRLDPLQGLARIFSLGNLVRLVMGLLKMALVAAVAYASLYGQREKVLGLAAMTTPQIAGFLTQILHLDEHEDRHGLARAGGPGLWLPVVEAGTRPADDDAGDPRGNEEPGSQSADGCAAEAGPAATGPEPPLFRGAQGRCRDHQPDRIGHRHPVRPGDDGRADRGRQGGRHDRRPDPQAGLGNGIPILERKPLAQALYREVEINHPIPQDRYAAVAEVLAYVYQLKGKKISDAR